MRTWLLPAVVLAVAGLLAVSASASWGPGGGCSPAFGPVGPPFAPVFTPAFAQPAPAPFSGWSASAKESGRWNFCYGGRCVGAFWEKDGLYYPYDWIQGKWLPAAPPPEPLPDRLRAVADAKAAAKAAGPEVVQNFGVDTAKLSGSTEPRYWVNGRRCNRRQAVEAITAGQLVDDSKKLRVTLIGPEADRRKAEAELAAGPERDKYLLQSYPPDHWAVARVGFVTTGKPTVYLQKPDGKVLLRQDVWDGPDRLIAAIRKADPTYDPRKDPDGKPAPAVPGVDGLLDWARGNPLLLLAAVVAAVVFLFPRRST